MLKQTNLCTICLESITNPLCPTCFSKHIILWLRDKNIPKNKLDLIKKKLINIIKKSEEYYSENYCIICGVKKVNLCTYCITEKTKKIMQENINKSTNKAFKEDFDTTIWEI